jgi:hypothetical protein
MNSLSQHVTLSEATRSDAAKRAGISNEPNAEQLARMVLLAVNVFEPLRNHFGVPIYISSFFRSKAVNVMIKGANNSEHMANGGAAMDLDAEMFGVITNKQIFEYIVNNLKFRQLIWEFGTNEEPDWVHVSYSEGDNKKEVLKAIKVNGSTQYIPFINIT